MAFESITQNIKQIPFFGTEILGRSMFEYSIAIIIFLIILLVGRLFVSIIISRLKGLSKKTKTKNDDLVVEILDKLNISFFSFLGLYFGLIYLNPPFTKWLNYLLWVVIAFYLTRIIFVAIDFLKVNKLEKEHNSGFLDLWIKISKGTIILIVVLLVLSNIGVNITSAVAAMGIGGIAVALALQSILSDIFASLSIHFDKPFEVGHFVIVGKDMGVIKKIGIKSTRIESLWGEEIVISNQELTSTRINNYKFMKKRRVQFSFGVTYNTQVNKLKKINNIVNDIFKTVKKTDLDRVNFKNFGDSSLNYEVAYYIDSGDYNEYMNIQEEINLKLVERLQKEKVEFAFPTRTIHIEK